jgi:hypothetical protein
VVRCPRGVEKRARDEVRLSEVDAVDSRRRVAIARNERTRCHAEGGPDCGIAVDGVAVVAMWVTATARAVSLVVHHRENRPSRVCGCDAAVLRTASRGRRFLTSLSQPDALPGLMTRPEGRVAAGAPEGGSS